MFNNVYHYRRISVAIAVDGHGWPWKFVSLLWFDVRGNCGGNCRELPRTFVVIAALPWQWPQMAAEIATPVSVNNLRRTSVGCHG